MANAAKTELLDATGIDAICERLTAGDSQRQIAEDLGVSVALLSTWLSAPERSARAREARIAAARQFDEKAEAELRAASDPFTLAKAKELAHHYRWKASKASPKEYGEKLAIGGAEDLPPLKGLSDDDLDARIQAKMEKLGVKD